MKAIEDFVIAVNKKGFRVSYRVGVEYKDLTFIKVKKGGEIPEKFIKEIIARNLELVDVKYVFRVPQLPKEYMPEIVTPKVMKIKKRKYTQESLTKIRNEGGFPALKKIGEEFDVTDRSSKRIITEILIAQEERQRKGL